MIHLKKFETFYVNDDSSIDTDEQEYLNKVKKSRSKREVEEEVEENDECETCEDKPKKKKTWGDEVIDESKKSNTKKPEKEKEEKEVTGLSPKQKKLPLGLQKAILKRMKNKKK